MAGLCLWRGSWGWEMSGLDLKTHAVRAPSGRNRTRVIPGDEECDRATRSTEPLVLFDFGGFFHQFVISAIETRHVTQRSFMLFGRGVSQRHFSLCNRDAVHASGKTLLVQQRLWSRCPRMIRRLIRRGKSGRAQNGLSKGCGSTEEAKGEDCCFHRNSLPSARSVKVKLPGANGFLSPVPWIYATGQPS